MKILCGTDIIEINRIKNSIENKGKVFLDKIYTQAEINYCESKRNAKYQHYAARFAAKEAIFKAISETLENKYDIKWTDVEIINDEKGKPRVNFTNSKYYVECDISLSHCREYATATAIIVIN